jgi:large subunit ribosomal protein L30
MPKKKEKKIRVTQIRSVIGQKPMHRKTITALGLHRIGHTKEFTDTPQIRGMVQQVNHMITWEEVES